MTFRILKRTFLVSIFFFVIKENRLKPVYRDLTSGVRMLTNSLTV